uniref:Uncharacterized protein n=1 Tax=Rhizophora mucronata TaxID=61149 RepID=A0A2P2NWL4_RHIMU
MNPKKTILKRKLHDAQQVNIYEHKTKQEKPIFCRSIDFQMNKKI